VTSIRVTLTGDGAVEHGVEVGAGVGEVPQLGDPAALAPGQQDGGVVADDGVPVPRREPGLCAHSRPPSFDSRLCSWRCES
jgi:hypothetical protein